MNRARREIKTPKRFDEEPFEAPRKSTGRQSLTPVVAEPAPTPVKNQIIQQPLIKLPKLGQRPSLKPIKDEILVPTHPQPIEDVKPIPDPTEAANAVTTPIASQATTPAPKQATKSSARFLAKAATKNTPKSIESGETPPAVPSPKPLPSPRGGLIKIKLPSSIKPREPPIEQPKVLVTPKAPVTPKVPATVAPKASITPKTPVAPKAQPVKTPVVKATTVKTQSLKSPGIKSPGMRSPTLKVPPIKSHSLKTSKRRRPATPPAYENLIPNKILPFWDARTAADEHEDDNVKELVHCHCGIPEELGLMVQCETCLTWQHAHCLGIDQPEDAPDGYTCQACSDPKFARDSMRWAYDQDWLLKGRMKQFACDKDNHEHEMTLLQRINLLIDNSLKIYQLIHSLRVKTKILQNATDDDDPDLKLFRVQWPANYVHHDGTPFIPTLNHLPSSPGSTMSAMAGTPDPGDLPVEAVADLRGALPDIGQLDVSAILGNTDIPMVPTNSEPVLSDCKFNLKLHIKQTEEFINIELNYISEQIAALERDIPAGLDPKQKINFESLKSDLVSMRQYLDQKTT